MISNLLHDSIVNGIRTLFLIGFPVVLLCTVVGMVVSALQTAVSVQDAGVLYGIKLAALAVLLYFMMPAFVNALLLLSRAIYGG